MARVEREVKVVEELGDVTITLSEDEALSLFAVCRLVGGSPGGRRGLFSNRRDSLEELLAKALRLSPGERDNSTRRTGASGSLNFD